MRGHDDLVARADLEHQQGQVQGGRAIGDGDGVRGTAAGGEFFFQLQHARALGDPAAADGLVDEGNLLVAHFGPHEWDGG